MTQKSSETSSSTPHISEAEFVAIYGEYPVAFEGLPRPITINFALAMEATGCPASTEIRSDESARLRKLAKYVGEEALMPEHRALLDLKPTQNPQ